MHKALTKANDDLISWCNCAPPAYATFGQLDCPWCGCGWLFTCTSCRRAFTFATVVALETPLAQIMLQERVNFYRMPVAMDDEEVISRTEWLEFELEQLPIGTTCAYLDGKILPINATGIKFNGWFARHTLDAVPHWTVGGSKAALNGMLGHKNYWLERELKDADTT